MTRKLPTAHRPVVFHAMVDRLPPSAAQPLAKDRALADLFGADVLLTAPLTAERSVAVTSMTSAIRAALAGAGSAKLACADGEELECAVELDADGSVLFTLPEGRFRYANADLHSPDASMRRRRLETMFAQHPLAAAEELAWLALSDSRTLEDHEISAVFGDVDATPEAFVEEIATTMRLDEDVLMPDDPSYYDRLIGPRQAETAFEDYVSGALAAFRRIQLSRHPGTTLRRIAFSGLSRSLVPFDDLEDIEDAAIETLLDAEDPFSLLFGFELVSVRAKRPGLVELGEAFLERLFLDPARAEDRRQLFCGCATICLALVRRKAKASDAPAYWTRLAALSHAGVLTQARAANKEPHGFAQWAFENFGVEQYWATSLERQQAPRWSPELISPLHLRAELNARAMLAIMNMPNNEPVPSWSKIVDGEAASDPSSRPMGLLLYPGPFEDFGPPAQQVALEDWERPPGGATTLLGLLAALPFYAKIGVPSPTTIDRLIRIVTEERDLPAGDMAGYLGALDAVAAISAAGRSTRLCDAVLDRCAGLLMYPDGISRAADLLGIAVTACGAIADGNAYRARIGAVFSSFAFRIEDKQTLGHLRQIVGFILLSTPKMAQSLARARTIADFKLRRGL